MWLFMSTSLPRNRFFCGITSFWNFVTLPSTLIGALVSGYSHGPSEVAVYGSCFCEVDEHHLQRVDI